MFASLLLLLRLTADPVAPSLAADFDGDGLEETITAAARRGAVRLELRDPKGRVLAVANAPAPDADVVHVELSAGPLGSPGALLGVAASTDAGACFTVWRFRGDALAPLPLNDAAGKPLADCGGADTWTYRWEQHGEGRPAALVRERSERAEQGTLRIREVFAFAGFSLDQDLERSGRDIAGVPIPPWRGAVLYSAAALEALFAHFDLSRLRSEPNLTILTDPERGVFALRFTGPAGDLTGPVESYAARAGEATLGARVGGKTVHAILRFGSDAGVPLEGEVEGLGAPWDQTYGPAGSLHGRAPKIFLCAVDEVVENDLAGAWLDAQGGQTTMSAEGTSPQQVRIAPDLLFAVDFERARRPQDLLLVPAGGSGRVWGIALHGKNFLERVPYKCPAAGEKGPCRADGPSERLRRLGARGNVE
ncbi:MAG TPA: hypothetical protein VGG65_02300 [Thermoanaerobaculia bacterium]